MAMDLTNLQTIKNLCRQYDLRPSRQNGQNFLVDRAVLNKLIHAADLKPTDTVLEVGAGFGVITKELVKLVKRIIAIELDEKFIPIIRNNIRDAKNLNLVPGDILKINLSEFLPLTSNIQHLPALNRAEGAPNFKVVANLPYNITSHFIRQCLTRSPRPEQMTLIVQKEVAERICARPGEMSLLSLSVQFYAEPELLEVVLRSSFWPEPEVDSAIIKINNIGRHRDLFVDKDFNDKDFFRLVHIGFSARRKMLKNNLAAGLKCDDAKIEQILEQAELNKKVRPQDLGIEDWIKLVRLIHI